MFFYTYAKKNANVKAKNGPLIKNELIISDPKNIAQVLREHYDSAYNKPDENCLVDDPVTLFYTTNGKSPSLTNIDFERLDLVASIMQIPNTVESVVTEWKSTFFNKNCNNNSCI